MPDDLKKRGAQDRSRVNVNEPHELNYWTQKLGVDEATLSAAVKQVGISVERVLEHLAGQTNK